MSYQLVKSINVNKKTIIWACNNIRPLQYYKTTFKCTEEEFIKMCLVSFLWGDMQGNSENIAKFNYVILEFKTKAEAIYKELEYIIWHNYDYKNKIYRFTEEEKSKAKAKLETILYALYMSLPQQNGKYVLEKCYTNKNNKNFSYYISKIKKYGYQYVFEEEEAKVYTNYYKAQLDLWKIGNTDYKIKKID